MNTKLSFKQQKTIEIEKCSIDGINLEFAIAKPTSTAFADFSLKSLKPIDFKDVQLSLDLHNQSENVIRIYDNISLSDILRETSKQSEILTFTPFAKANDENFKYYSVPLPLGYINLKNEEFLDLDLRFNNLDLTADLDKSSVNVSLKNAIGQQTNIISLERIDLDTDQKKKYPFSGNLTNLTLCTDDLSVVSNLKEVRLKSDLIEFDANLSDLRNNGYDLSLSVTPKNNFLTIFKSATPLKNVEVEVIKEASNGVNMYFLVKRSHIPTKIFKRASENQTKHARENLSRLLTK